MFEKLSAAFLKREETLKEISIIEAVIKRSMNQIDERRAEIVNRQIGLKYSIGRKKELENRLKFEEGSIEKIIKESHKS